MRCKAGMFSRSAKFQTSLLLHFDGTTIVDSSGANRTITAASSAALSTTESKFGGSSLAVGPGYVYTPDDAAFDFGADDFTIELWYYDSTGDGGTLAGQWAYAGYAWFLSTSEFIFNTTSAMSWSAAASDQWNHIAVCRASGTIRVFLNGSQVASAEIGTDAIAASSAFIGIGRDEYGNPTITGYIDEVRITKGLARYTGTFTPPSAAFPDP